jgi:hypothetical protein
VIWISIKRSINLPARGGETEKGKRDSSLKRSINLLLRKRKRAWTGGYIS